MKSVSSIILTFFLLTAGCFILPSCTEKEQIGVSDAKITFANPVISPLTRTPGNPVFPKDQQFMVFAQWDKNGFQAWEDAGSVLYMNGVETHYDAGTDGWIPAETYLWPKEGALTFAAYAPAGLNAVYGSLNRASYGHSGLHINQFSVEPDPAAQVDILYSRRSYNRTGSYTLGNLVSPYQGVDIVFQHALSQVRFTIKTSDKNLKKDLTSLELKNIHRTGTFDEWVLEDPDGPYDVYRTDDSQHRKWKLTGRANAAYTIFTNQQVGSQKIVSVPFILMPQRFAKGPGPQGSVIDAKNAKLVFTWSDGTTQNLVLNDIITVWEPGKSYTYNITIGSSKINFKPDISVDWLDKGGIEILPD